MGDDALVLAGVHAGHPGTPVLCGVDLTVSAGSLTAVLGGSGCGKTTLLRTVAGFHPLDAGAVDLAGRRVAGDGVAVAPERRRFGLVAQDGALFSHLDVAANVGYGLDRAGRRGGRVGEMLELVGLAGFERRMPAELSGGQQQRVALARALAPAPALILLDEPFVALDTGLRAEVREQVLEALRAADATAVLVTHDQQEALAMADQVAVLRDGRIVQVDDPRTVYGEPADLEVGTFVGDAVVLGGDLVVPGVAHPFVRTLLGELPVSGLSAETPHSRGRVLVRPEQLRLVPGDQARVVNVAFHGHDTTIAVEAGGKVLHSRAPGSSRWRAGDHVSVSVDGPVRYFPTA